MSVEDKLICTRGLECLLNGIRDNMGSSGGTQSDGLTFEKGPDGLWHAKDETGDLGAIGVIPSDRFVITEENTYDLVYDPLGVWKRSDTIIVPGETNCWEPNLDVLSTLTAAYTTEFAFIPSSNFYWCDKVYAKGNIFCTEVRTGNRVKSGGLEMASFRRVGSVSGTGSVMMYEGDSDGSGNGASGDIGLDYRDYHALSIRRGCEYYETLKAGTKQTFCVKWTPLDPDDRYTDYEGTIVWCFPKLVSVI